MFNPHSTKKSFVKKKSGLILTEALLAITLLAIGTTILTGIIQNAIKTSVLSKNYLIAQNLATEAIEGVKNIRNTNWLKEPDDSTCWMNLDPYYGACPNKPVADSNYLLKKDDGIWSLDYGPDEDLDLTYEDDMAQYRLYLEDEGDYFTYSSLATSEPSLYYRSVKFKSISDESADLEVKIQWKEGVKMREIVRSSILYNYIK